MTKPEIIKQTLNETESKSSNKNKIKIIFNEFSNLLEKVGGNYSPILIEELFDRLSLIIKNFNDDAYMIFNTSFKKWKIKDNQMREILNNNIIESTLTGPEKKKKAIPNFIKDTKFGPLKHK